MPAAADAEQLASLTGHPEEAAERALVDAEGDVGIAMSALLEAALPEDLAVIRHYNPDERSLDESLLDWETTFTFDTLGYCVLPAHLGADHVRGVVGAEGRQGDGFGERPAQGLVRTGERHGGGQAPGHLAGEAGA